jgi:LuxR family transcriptional regulator, quorum-sensing system regulator SdiA
MAVVAIGQPHRAQRGEMGQRASIAALLHDLDQQSPAGFAIALHIRFTTPTYLFQTYPKRWMDYYSSAGLVVHDPTVHWGLQNVGHVRWADLEAIDGEGVLEKAKDFGIMNGVAISVFMSGSRSIASFARADREYEEIEMAELEDVLAQLHRATIGLSQLSESDQRALTELSIKLTH